MNQHKTFDIYRTNDHDIIILDLTFITNGLDKSNKSKTNGQTKQQTAYLDAFS